MALIKCPECEKEISDKANTCPNCGCPIHKEENDGVANDVKPVGNEKAKVNKMVLIIGVAVAVLIVTVVGIMLSKKSKSSDSGNGGETVEDADKQTYRDASDLLLQGKYEEAKELFDTIPDYSDVPTILEQIPWETKTFVCLDGLKERLKDPDSLTVYDVYFFGTEAKEDAKLDASSLESFRQIFGSDAPASLCMIHYGATNTMGGKTDSIAFFMYDKDSKSFQYYGSTKTLDEDKATDDEEDIVFLYNTMKDNFITVGNVDTSRVNSILKSGVYINVHIID